MTTTDEAVAEAVAVLKSALTPFASPFLQVGGRNALDSLLERLYQAEERAEAVEAELQRTLRVPVPHLQTYTSRIASLEAQLTRLEAKHRRLVEAVEVLCMNARIWSVVPNDLLKLRQALTDSQQEEG